MNHRTFNILSIVLILLWIWADRHLRTGAPAYGWLLLIYVTVLFCGSYFIRWGFFMKSVCKVNTSEKWIALTFDDGPAGESTERVLDILHTHHVEATFFCIGKNIEGREEQLKKMIHDGHLIGNHSFSHHPFFDFFSTRRIIRDIDDMTRVTREITRLSPRFFRPPYGVTNPHIKKAVLSSGLIPVGWSIRSYDTVIKNEDRLLRRILNRMKPGSILLLHDHSEVTVRILGRLIGRIEAKGYKVMRLDKMINLNPYA